LIFFFTYESISFNGAAAFQPRKYKNFFSSIFENYLLQWSRSFSAAEIIDMALNPRRSSRLQWSRSFSAAEILDGDVRRPDPGQRFNGAAAFQPRKFLSREDAFPRTATLQWSRSFSAAEILSKPDTEKKPGKLQWSRSFSAAEIRIDRRQTKLGFEASMEPQLFSRGNTF